MTQELFFFHLMHCFFQLSYDVISQLPGFVPVAVAGLVSPGGFDGSTCCWDARKDSEADNFWSSKKEKTNYFFLIFFFFLKKKKKNSSVCYCMLLYVIVCFCWLFDQFDPQRHIKKWAKKIPEGSVTSLPRPVAEVTQSCFFFRSTSGKAMCAF